MCFPVLVEVYGLSPPSCCVYLLHSLSLAEEEVLMLAEQICSVL